MKVGYARTSTIDQQSGIEAQKRDLITAGCEEIFYEHASAVKKRDKLEEALNYVRNGDIFVVTKLDRLARSLPDLHRILERLNDREVTLHILDMGLDTSTANGKLMLQMMASFAQFEREIMLERQKEGIAKARLEGKYKGRKPVPQEIEIAVVSYLETGVSKVWISKKLNLGKATIYRIANRHKKPRSA